MACPARFCLAGHRRLARLAPNVSQPPVCSASVVSLELRGGAMVGGAPVRVTAGSADEPIKLRPVVRQHVLAAAA